eukprot:1388771-Prymnesium_polylepis.1
MHPTSFADDLLRPLVSYVIPASIWSPPRPAESLRETPVSAACSRLHGGAGHASRRKGGSLSLLAYWLLPCRIGPISSSWAIRCVGTTP